MAEASGFNMTTGQKAERNLLIAYANTGTSEAPVWEAMGLGVEDSSIDFDFGESIKTDILGVTGITMKAPTRKQSFEPCEIREGSALQIKLYNALRYERWSELMAMDLLIVHYYVGTTGSFEAERYSGSAIIPKSLGGSSTLDMPFDVVYGGTRALGTAAIAAGVVTFTPAA
jgi:hypothetical protein